MSLYLILELFFYRSHLFQDCSVLDESLDGGVILDGLAERLPQHDVRQVGEIVQHLKVDHTCNSLPGQILLSQIRLLRNFQLQI